MSLPDKHSSQIEQYSLVIGSMSQAPSPTDALGMLLAQIGTGSVSVEIHNSDTGESWDLDKLESQNAEDQLALALALLRRHAGPMSNHQKVHVAAKIDTILGIDRPRQ